MSARPSPSPFSISRLTGEQPRPPPLPPVCPLSPTGWAAGAEAAAGAGSRPKRARGARIGRPAVSLYARDTDENLPEWMVYLEG